MSLSCVSASGIRSQLERPVKQHRLSQLETKAGGAVLIKQNNTGLTPSVLPIQAGPGGG